MELRTLQYFLAVAREQSISSAAQSLHLSQPTISIQLKSLEQELGCQLLVRGTKGSRKVTLTEEGMLLRKRAQEILELVHKTELEIELSADTVAGDLYIGAGETELVRIVARAARALLDTCPDLHYHLFSGNAFSVWEKLDGGLLDFGIVYGAVDSARYNALRLPVFDTWGVLMRKDAPLARKEQITPEDLYGVPLILSEQESQSSDLVRWFQCDPARLQVIATYNLIFNASLLVDEGLGYAVTLDKLINTTGESPLCFRPLLPRLEAPAHFVWKKYQVLSKAGERFLQQVRALLAAPAP